MQLHLNVNGKDIDVDVPDDQSPLLWVLRDYLDLKGTKFGCGKSACGACTVLLDGEAVRSCTFPVKFAVGKQITTIEGLGNAAQPHPVQSAWIAEIVPQCGYCQPGFMMATAALLNKNPEPTDQDIDEQITNICRCGTHYRIRTAIHKAAKIKRALEEEVLIKNKEGHGA